MRCPYCNSMDTRVSDSRPTHDGDSVRRRRECNECGARFTTYEIYEKRSLIVRKRDGNREVFNRTKMLGGMIKSCEKRPVPVVVLEKAAEEIEAELLAMNKKEIRSTEIGERIMDKLQQIDQVAYVRFASVYRDFKDVDSFYEELRKLREQQSE